MFVWRAASELCFVRPANGRRFAVYVPEDLVAGGAARSGQRARSAGSAAPGGAALYQGAEARARRALPKRRGLSGVRGSAERQISFADWELMRQGLRLEPLLQAISDFLDDQNDMIEQVRCDLTRGLKKAETGRSGLTPQQVLRSLVLMRVKNWDYRELRERIADGCTLRQFTDFYCLTGAATRCIPPRLQSADARRRSRRSMIWWCRRQSTSGWRTAKAARRHHGGADRHSSSDRQHAVVGCRSRRDAPDWPPCGSAGTPAYQGFPGSDAIGAAPDARDSTDDIETTPGAADRDIPRTHRHCRGGYRQAHEPRSRQTRKVRGTDMITDLAIAETRKEIEHFCGLGARVIDQSRRRVLNGEQVPTPRSSIRFSSPIPTLSSAARCRRRSSSATRCFLPKARTV